jgi:predicted DNA-binding transcriptional regulator YafY
MDKTERFYKIHGLLNAGKCLPLKHFVDTLEVSRATMVRDIAYMRDRLGAPIVYDPDRGGYRYDRTQQGADKWDLPGVWFNAAEIQAFVVVHALLHDIAQGFLEEAVAPLLTRSRKLLETHQVPPSEVAKRIRLLNVSHRDAPPAHFQTAAQAVLQRQKVKLLHYNRQDDRRTEREVSPQRLIHYRGTWYLDGWCHLRKGLRSFSLDAIEQLRIVEGAPKELDEQALDDYFAQSYGIFSGEANQVAVLRFTPERARWVKNERWHPKQVGTLEAGGAYRLEIPFGNDTELVMDILRHGPAVEVLQPESLRKRVREQALALAAQYG